MGIVTIRTSNLKDIYAEVEAWWLAHPQCQVFHVLTMRNGESWESYIYYEGRIT